ncbi:hypothetical protein ACFZBU_43385 [Embleya sp. NPDC008237]|uniref:hypothetical protein n=1 Tax=Embleya sp. NPDC008237 TaxID=3363978 RepID=UPI0036E1BEB9
MDDVFTLLCQALDLLPEDAAADNGQTVGDVREDLGRREWGPALGVLEEIADVHPVSVDFWELLAEAARRMALDRSRRWCRWRAWEVRHGTIRATLHLMDPKEGGPRTAFPGDGRLRPMWDIGGRSRSTDGERALRVARLWVEFQPRLGPGETATVRLAPLHPEQWRHLEPGDVTFMHQARLVADPPPAHAGIAEIIEILPPRV